MKYMLMFVQEEDGWEETASAEERQATFGKIGEWWAQLSAAGKMLEGHQLQPASTATTVETRSGVVTDGPFLEAKESVGGYGIVEAADLDAAIAIAKTWPATNKVEVRPVIEQAGM
ncbi:MAG: YciI family protein [Candidatus Dormibacteraeota bacterium]|nr:YciI family protein [Candidatus Dormibacteraeota bacterium]